MTDKLGDVASALLRTVFHVFLRNVSRHYFDMRGRVRRQEFWQFILACVVIYIGAFVVELFIGRRMVTPVIGLVLLLPIASIGARRLQDTGKTGMLIWAYSVPTAALELVSLVAAYRAAGLSGVLVPMSNLCGALWLAAVIVFSYLWAQAGVAGTNRYGPEPTSAAPTSV
jgi:uncharacterized membrane protein YhaH (DUF805 family)